MHEPVRARLVEMAVLCGLVLGSGAGRGEARADELPGLDPGTRVRVTLAADSVDEDRGERLVGRFSKLGPESLRVDTGSAEMVDVPREAVVRLERSVRPSRKGRGALIGFGVGFAAMFTLYNVAAEGDCFRDGGCEGVVFLSSALLALPAAAVGAIVAPGEEWEDVTLRRPQVRTPAREGGLALRVVPMVGRRNGVAIVGSF